jgi:hypothetical protein
MAPDTHTHGHKIVRTVCAFSASLDPMVVERLNTLVRRLEAAGYAVQTRRLCTAIKDIDRVENAVHDRDLVLSVGTLSMSEAREQLRRFYAAGDVSFNIDLTHETLETRHTAVLFDIINNQPDKTFNFTYVFNNPGSSPYFPSATYQHDGFAIGLQPTNLSQGCQSLHEWLRRMQATWEEIHALFRHDSDFLGIDSSVAPLFAGSSSLIHFVKRLGLSFAQSVLTDVYLTVTQHLEQYNPKPVGLCGLMFPCLEDFELAEEYDNGQFPIERNLYLSLHSGLGIDTYPLGVDERPEMVLHVLRVLQGLARKYGKALSARFASDGKARIGERTDFGNPYLQDVTIRPLIV